MYKKKGSSLSDPQKKESLEGVLYAMEIWLKFPKREEISQEEGRQFGRHLPSTCGGVLPWVYPSM